MTRGVLYRLTWFECVPFCFFLFAQLALCKWNRCNGQSQPCMPVHHVSRWAATSGAALSSLHHHRIEISWSSRPRAAACGSSSRPATSPAASTHRKVRAARAEHARHWPVGPLRQSGRPHVYIYEIAFRTGEKEWTKKLGIQRLTKFWYATSHAIQRRRRSLLIMDPHCSCLRLPYS